MIAHDADRDSLAIAVEHHGIAAAIAVTLYRATAFSHSLLAARVQFDPSRAEIR